VVFVAHFTYVSVAAAQGSWQSRSDSLFEPWKNSAPMSRDLSVLPRKIFRSVNPLPSDESKSLRGLSAPRPRLTNYDLPPHLRRQVVDYSTREAAGTIAIDTASTYLYLVLGNGKALRYGIGVGREGFTWVGRLPITRRAEWPDWRPPPEMIERHPDLPRLVVGGIHSPLGARALYLGHTLYRIHGTNEPETIGTFRSSGCFRMLNDDIIDLYQRVSIGTTVVVLPRAP
jgi:lipoprotein-anchoring transpeptidase ErfK/SrfK